ncbi:MAG: M23 family metallopeptidase [Candidatus Gracilibacteria bacterium]|nr:M23 family metallopeptidase [Candidatus Gracilibacteria bacterium]
MYKIFVIILSSIIGFISLIFYYSAFSSVYATDDSIQLDLKLTNNIYLDSDNLNNTLFLYKSDYDLKQHKFTSSCSINSKLIGSNSKYYLFEVKYLDDNCDDGNISLVSEEKEVVRNEKINIFSKSKIYNIFLDYNTSDLEKFNMILNNKLEELVNNKTKNRKFKIRKDRKVQEINYIKGIIEHILLKREENYVMPVLGKTISDHPSRVPNARRPYRASITDGIHHGWDIYGPLGEETISIDDGLVVRVIRDFQYSDLSKLNRSSNLSDLEKAKNLDIYRGNQVWIKTMKGDIVIYSHLTEVSSNIKEGEIINKGDFVGTTGITGVPDKNYKDYHLHFTVHKNPFDSDKVGNYTIDDYLLWDWYYKGRTISYVLENQNKIFKDYSTYQ